MKHLLSIKASFSKNFISLLRMKSDVLCGTGILRLSKELMAVLFLRVQLNLI